jgi:hypothetical protein
MNALRKKQLVLLGGFREAALTVELLGASKDVIRRNERRLSEKKHQRKIDRG